MITRQVHGLTSSSQHGPRITAISNDNLLQRHDGDNRCGTHHPDGRVTGDLAVHFPKTPFHHSPPVPFHVTLTTPHHFLRHQPVQPLLARLRHLSSAVAVVHRKEVALRCKPYLRAHRVLHLRPAPYHRRRTVRQNAVALLRRQSLFLFRRRGSQRQRYLHVLVNLSLLSFRIHRRRLRHAASAGVIPDADLRLASVLHSLDFDPSPATVLEPRDDLAGIRLHWSSSVCRRRLAFWRLHSRFCM